MARGRNRRGLLLGLQMLNESLGNIYDRKRQRIGDAYREEEAGRLRQRFDWEKEDREASKKQPLLNRIDMAKEKNRIGGLIGGALAGGQSLESAIRLHQAGVPADIAKRLLPVLEEPETPRSETAIEFYKRDPEAYRSFVEAGWRPYKESGDGSSPPSSVLDKGREAWQASKLLAEEMAAAEPPSGPTIDSLVRSNRSLNPDAVVLGQPSPSRFLGHATKFVPGAGDLPIPKPAAPDAYEAMDETEWLTVVNAAITDALNRPVTKEEIDSNPMMQVYVFADPKHRRRLFADIPRMFIREEQ